MRRAVFTQKKPQGSFGAISWIGLLPVSWTRR